MLKTDHILVKRLKNGDEVAFRQLVNDFQDKVFNTCISLVKDADDADDLTQETFIEVYHSIHKFRADSRLSTWIYRIAVNKSLEHLRRLKRKKRTGILTWISSQDPEPAFQVSDFNHPGVLAEKREQAKILIMAIDKLPENQKIAFTLHKMEDLSYEEIAEIMKKSLSSVESLMHRAKINLRKDLSDYYNS
ncbi:MAG: RNA polymerase sigma factor [Cyclobacteriaceae bacterium]|nr:RNA polymerase sigma factor [Cyclobacteriaceae bacterium]